MPFPSDDLYPGDDVFPGDDYGAPVFMLSDGLRQYDFLGGGDIYVAREGLNVPLFELEDVFAESPSADGRSRIRSRRLNAESSFTVYVKGADADTFWNNVNDLQDLVSSAHDRKGWLLYQPFGGSVVFWDIESIHVSGLPQDGVLQAQRHCEATVTFEVLPYARRVARNLVETDTLTGPVDWFEVSGVKGHLPAWGKLSLTEDDSVARYRVEVGVQNDFDPDDPEPVLLEAVTEFTASAGLSTTRAGSVSTNVLRAYAGSNAVTVGTTGSQSHQGWWKVHARCWPSDSGLMVRLAWRVGTGAWSFERWVTVPGVDDWFDMDLGAVNVPELPSGHSVEFTVQVLCQSGLGSVDVDIVELVPADRWCLLGGRVVTESQSGMVAYDDFSELSAGDVSGQAPMLAPAGNWTGAGDSDDFQARGGYISRNDTADTDVSSGRFLICGSGTTDTIVARADIRLNVPPYDPPGLRAGIVIRYTDTNNWLMAVYTELAAMQLIKCVSGTETVIGTAYNFTTFYTGWRTLVATVTDTGTVIVSEGPQNGSLDFQIITTDSDLASGGNLETGKYGLYDACDDTLDPTHAEHTNHAEYTNFQVNTPSSTTAFTFPALNADQETLLLHNAALTETDDVYGSTPVREGNYLQLPAATGNDLSSRIVVRARRNLAGLPDTGVDDTLIASLDVVERVIATPPADG